MILGQGAEAILRKVDEKTVLKERIPKQYRIAPIDFSLRRARTRREANILRKLEALKFPAPKLQHVDDKEMTLRMDFVPGPKVRDVIEQNVSLAKEIGKKT